MGPHSPLTCSESQLILSVPVAELPADERRAVTDWLHEHGVASRDLALGYAIERAADRAALTWRVTSPRGVERHTVYLPRVAGSWPAPFPELLMAAELAA